MENMGFMFANNTRSMSPINIPRAVTSLPNIAFPPLNNSGTVNNTIMLIPGQQEYVIF